MIVLEMGSGASTQGNEYYYLVLTPQVTCYPKSQIIDP